MERQIGLELRSLNNKIMRYLDNYHTKKYIDSITGTNGWIIGYLAEHANRDVYQRDLEAEFTITRSTASKVINLMEQKGLVERQSVPHDARLKKLVLTPKAQSFSEDMRRHSLEMEAILTGGFSDEERRQLTGFLLRMKENVDRAANEANETKEG